jgi:uncharacterized protein YegP (UPF0339 family)
VPALAADPGAAGLAGGVDGHGVDGEYAEPVQLTNAVGEMFPTTYNANRASVSFKAGASSARYETFLDTAGAWRWRAWRSSSKVAASGESFANSYNARRAADNVRANAAYASGL